MHVYLTVILTVIRLRRYVSMSQNLATTYFQLEAMFNKVDNCPIQALNEIHYCAAQGIDHRQCCESNGVNLTAAGRKCLSFCDQRPNKFTPIDATYLPCYEVFEGMKQCFYYEIK